MISRRRRIIFYYERQQTLNEFKLITGRSIDLIPAQDLATAEAALRLYPQIDVIAAEKSSGRTTSIAVLHHAEQRHPRTPRVLMVDHEAMSGVYEAVHDRTVNSLLFMPVRLEQLRDALGIDTPPAKESEDPLLTRRHGYPPLTGGIKASSSPSLIR